MVIDTLYFLAHSKLEQAIAKRKTRVLKLNKGKFLSPTNAPLNYTYKTLKYTARLSHYCSYIFRSTWTIIREAMPNLPKVTILWK